MLCGALNATTICVQCHNLLIYTVAKRQLVNWNKMSLWRINKSKHRYSEIVFISVRLTDKSAVFVALNFFLFTFFEVCRWKNNVEGQCMHHVTSGGPDRGSVSLCDKITAQHLSPRRCSCILNPQSDSPLSLFCLYIIIIVTSPKPNLITSLFNIYLNYPHTPSYPL